MCGSHRGGDERTARQCHNSLRRHDPDQVHRVVCFASSLSKPLSPKGLPVVLLHYGDWARVQEGFVSKWLSDFVIVNLPKESLPLRFQVMGEFLKLVDPNTIELLKFLLPLFGAVVAWYLNERKKRAWEEYQLKESNYKELILALKGFYASSEAPERKLLKNKFIDQLNLCWLYSPDDVIFAGYSFIRAVHTEAGKVPTEEQKQDALGKFIIAIRKDLLSRQITRTTVLKSKDFMLLTST